MKKVFLVAIGFGCLSLGNLKAQFVVSNGTVNSNNLFTNGNVGIGFATSATAPSAKLHLKTGNLLVENGVLTVGSTVGTDTYWMNFNSASSVLFKVGYVGAGMGSLTSDMRYYKTGYLNVRNNDINLSLGAVSGLSGASLKSDGNLNLFAGSSNLVLGTNTTERLRIDGATGFIGINTGAVAPAYNLDVNGTARVSNNLTLGAGLIMSGKLVIGGAVTNAIYANDAAVKMTVQGTIVSKRIVCATPAWADFVFDKNYKLESLSDVEKYIAINKHLPGIPSAEELVNTGIDPAELLKLQMMKIEELTLHSISQQKLLDLQAKQLDFLSKKVDQLISGK